MAPVVTGLRHACDAKVDQSAAVRHELLGEARVRAWGLVLVAISEFVRLEILLLNTSHSGIPHPLFRLQTKVLRIIGNFPRRTPVRELYVAFKIPYVYDFITKLCTQQAEVIQNHVNPHVRNIGQREAQHRKYKRLKLGGVQAYDRSSD
jgi:hypothetical protein